jgi:hypothetical protein
MTGETTMATQDIVQEIVAILRNGRRIDRFLRVADDGHYYTTPDKTYLTNNGPDTPPYVTIPYAGSDVTDDEAEAWVELMIEELEAQS